jgi:DHA1 family multidrug resistance protein-like MFS transporter
VALLFLGERPITDEMTSTVCSTFGSSIYSSAIPYIASDYGVSTEVTTLGLSLYIVGYIPGPILFAPLS